MENCTFTPPALSQRQLLLLRIEYFAFALIPVALIYFGIIPKQWEYLFSTLFIMSAVSVWMLRRRVKKNRFSWTRAGVTRDFRKGIVFYVVSITLAVICFIVAPYVTPVRTEFSTNTVLWFTLLGSPMQELLFRVYLWTLGTMIFSPRVNFVANVSVFVLMHVFYDNLLVVMPSVVFAGILFTALFKKHPNYVLAALNHIVWGALAIYVYIFS